MSQLSQKLTLIINQLNIKRHIRNGCFAKPALLANDRNNSLSTKKGGKDSAQNNLVKLARLHSPNSQEEKLILGEKIFDYYALVGP